MTTPWGVVQTTGYRPVERRMNNCRPVGLGLVGKVDGVTVTTAKVTTVKVTTVKVTTVKVR
jgi:hypothetical protein